MNKKEYKHKWYLEHRSLTIKRSSSWNLKNTEARKRIVARNNKKSAVRKRIWLEQRNFGGNATLLENMVCKKCGSNYRLGIHHIDGDNGKMGKINNTDPKNLIVLCVRCHSSVHGWWGVKPI